MANFLPILFTIYLLYYLEPKGNKLTLLMSGINTQLIGRIVYLVLRDHYLQRIRCAHVVVPSLKQCCRHEYLNFLMTSNEFMEVVGRVPKLVFAIQNCKNYIQLVS